MLNFFGTFPAGVRDFAISALKEHDKDVAITYSDESFIAFSSKLPMDSIKKWAFLSTIYADITDKVVPKAVNTFLKENNYQIKSKVEYVDGKAAKTTPLATAYNAKIQPLTLRVEKRGQNVFSGIPIASNHSEIKGMLSPTVSFYMCYIAGIKPNMRILDPFAGYGAIADSILRSFNPRKIYLIEKAQEIALNLKKKYSTISKVTVINENCLKALVDFPYEYDAIATDPPWGLYENRDVTRELGQFISIVARARRPITLLLDRNIVIKEIADSCEYNITKQVDILVSGHKASIYVLSVG